MNKKRIFVISSIIFVVLIITLFVSYGYVMSEISGNETGKEVTFNSQIIKVEYSGGTETLSSNQSHFTPGSVLTKTFTIKNTGNVAVKYSINLDNIINTFERKKDITYELSSNDIILKNGMQDAKGIFPSSKTTILSKDILNKDESKTYTLKIIYLNSEENQIIDNGKNLSANIKIDDSVLSINTVALYGNSIQEGTPTPTTPSDIKSVGDKTRNLFNHNEIYKRYSDDEIIKENNKITINTPTRGGTKWFWTHIPVKSNEIYTIYCKGFVSSGSTFITRYKFVTDKITSYNSTSILENVSSSQKESFTVTANIDGYLLLIWTLPVAESSFYFENVQVEKGNILSDYEPYGYRVPIKVSGKNIFNENDIENNMGLNIEDGRTYADANLITSNFIDIDSNTDYILNWKTKKWYCFYDEAGNYIGYDDKNQFTTPQSAKFLRITFLVEELYTLQLEKGISTTTYEPFVEPRSTNIYLNEPLRKLEETADYIDFEKQKVFRKIWERKIVGTQVVTSSDNIRAIFDDGNFSNALNLYGSVAQRQRYGLILSFPSSDSKKMATNKAQTKNGLCTVLQTTDVLATTYPHIVFGWQSNVIYMLNFSDTAETTTDLHTAFTNIVNNTDFRIVYLLATPTEEEIELPDNFIHNGTNIIEVDTEVQPSNIEVEYN